MDVTFSISLSNLFSKQRQLVLRRPKSRSTVTQALDNSLLDFFLVCVRRIYC